MDEVFRALADPTRRALLDELFQKDGQTLSALCAHFDMSRIGVAKHLGILESAGLVATRRHGREKHHHLNPIPIRMVLDRWIDKYTEPWVAGLVDLKQELEHEMDEPTMEKVFEIYIRTTPERLWEAICDPETRRRFHFGNSIESDWTEGSGYAITNPNAGAPLVEGVNLVVDPPRRLVQTYHARWDDDVDAAGTSQLSWEIEPVGDSCRLVLVHSELPVGASEALYGGWPMILSGLKSWLETGKELTTPGSLMYG